MKKKKASLFFVAMLGLWALCSVAGSAEDGLIAHWSFDEGSGTAAHDSVGSNHGTVYGSLWTTGQTGGALRFDGVNDYVALPDNEPIWLPQNNFTLSVWVYFEREPGVSPEFILDLNFGSSVDPANELGYAVARKESPAGKLGFYITTPTNPDEYLNSEEVLARNRWYHIVAVRDGTTQTIYIDGQWNASRTCSADPIDFVGGYDNDKVNIGRFSRAHGLPYNFPLKGIIDDVRIYDQGLSDKEIEDLYLSYLVRHEVAVDIKPGSCPNPINVASRGVLPVAVLGTEDFDVNTIDIASIRLAGVAPIRSSFEDVATPVADGNECDCNTAGPDGYTDLTLKFKTQEIVEELLKSLGELVDGEELVLTLTGVLSDGTPIEGTDCVVIVGKVPKLLAAKRADVNGDGIVNILDFAIIAQNWLEPAAVEY